MSNISWFVLFLGTVAGFFIGFGFGKKGVGITGIIIANWLACSLLVDHVLNSIK